MGWDIFFQSVSSELEQRENVCNEFLSHPDAEVPEVYFGAKVAEGRCVLYR